MPGPKIFKGALGQLISKRGALWSVILLDCVQTQCCQAEVAQGSEAVYWCPGGGCVGGFGSQSFQETIHDLSTYKERCSYSITQAKGTCQNFKTTELARGANPGVLVSQS